MYAGIVFPLPIEKEFDYLVPPEMDNKIKVGARVVVPWHGHKKVGYVIYLKEKSNYRNCQSIIQIVDEKPHLAEEHFALARWMSQNYFCSFGKALATILPPDTRFISFPNNSMPESFQKQIATQIPHRKLNLIPGQFYWLPDFPASAEREIYPEFLNSGDFSQRSVLFLVPDVQRAKHLYNYLLGLTRLPIYLWHSSLNSRQKSRLNSGWRPIVVATRGGLFLPDLSPDKIIVEDEFSVGQHQDSEPFYYLRDVAAFVARQKKSTLIFVEKVPSAAVSKAVLDNRIKVLAVPERKPVKVSVLSRENFPKKIFSPALRQKIQENLLQRKQVMLIHSQGAYSRQLECQRCHTVINCENCSVALKYYKQKNVLSCRYCGRTIPVPENCPGCGGKYFQPKGVGRERLIEYLAKDFPGYRIAGEKDANFNSADILVAGIKSDERLIAENRLGLIAFLNLDVFISRPDFTAAEEAYRIVNNFTQYFHNSGEIIILTRYPEHYLLEALKSSDDRKFWSEELSLRQTFAYPPVKTMLIFNLRSSSRITGEKVAQHCFTAISPLLSPEDILLGPVETTPHKLRKKFHWQIILKISPERQKEIYPAVQQLLREINLPAAVYLKVAVEGSFFNETF